MDDITQEQVTQLKAQLVELGSELTSLLAISVEDAKPVELDLPIGRLSRMDAMQQQKMAQATRRAAQQRLKQVEAALRRCDRDEYGDCLECGESIGFARLSVGPEAPLCVACQSQLERQI